MSLMQHIEENAEHLLRVLKHMMQIEQNMYGSTLDVTQKIHDSLEDYVNPTPTPVPVVDATPIVSEPVVVETPQIIAKKQSASNVAN